MKVLRGSRIIKLDFVLADINDKFHIQVRQKKRKLIEGKREKVKDKKIQHFLLAKTVMVNRTN